MADALASGPPKDIDMETDDKKKRRARFYWPSATDEQKLLLYKEYDDRGCMTAPHGTNMERWRQLLGVLRQHGIVCGRQSAKDEIKRALQEFSQGRVSHVGSSDTQLAINELLSHMAQVWSQLQQAKKQGKAKKRETKLKLDRQRGKKRALRSDPNHVLHDVRAGVAGAAMILRQNLSRLTEIDHEERSAELGVSVSRYALDPSGIEQQNEDGTLQRDFDPISPAQSPLSARGKRAADVCKNILRQNETLTESVSTPTGPVAMAKQLQSFAEAAKSSAENEAKRLELEAKRIEMDAAERAMGQKIQLQMIQMMERMEKRFAEKEGQ